MLTLQELHWPLILQDTMLSGASSSSNESDSKNRTTDFNLAAPKLCLLCLLALTSAAIIQKPEPHISDKAVEEFYSVHWQVSDFAMRSKTQPTIISRPVTIFKDSSSTKALARAGRESLQNLVEESGVQAIHWTASALQGLQQTGKQDCMIFNTKPHSHSDSLEKATCVGQRMATEAVNATMRTACLEVPQLKSRVFLRDDGPRSRTAPLQKEVCLTPR